jgi:hypothetical protein
MLGCFLARHKLPLGPDWLARLNQIIRGICECPGEKCSTEAGQVRLPGLAAPPRIPCLHFSKASDVESDDVYGAAPSFRRFEDYLFLASLLILSRRAAIASSTLFETTNTLPLFCLSVALAWAPGTATADLTDDGLTFGAAWIVVAAVFRAGWVAPELGEPPFLLFRSFVMLFLLRDHGRASW